MGVALYIIAFFAIGAAPPLRWGLRTAIAVILLFFFVLILTPTPYDPDWGFDLARAALLWTMITVLAGVALRGFFEAGVFGPLSPAGADHLFLIVFDAALRFGLGAWVGCLIFRALATILPGSDGGLALHLQVAGVAAALAATALLLLRNRWCAPFLGAGFVVAALALDGGYRYPNLILSKANQIWPRQTRCLMIGADLSAPTSPADLMALTIPKVKIDPSAVVLMVQSVNGPRLFRWSFRERAFVILPRDAKDLRFCAPSLSTLRFD